VTVIIATAWMRNLSHTVSHSEEVLDGVWTLLRITTHLKTRGVCQSSLFTSSWLGMELSEDVKSLLDEQLSKKASGRRVTWDGPPRTGNTENST
jgi:hypothetical protein